MVHGFEFLKGPFSYPRYLASKTQLGAIHFSYYQKYYDFLFAMVHMEEKKLYDFSAKRLISTGGLVLLSSTNPGATQNEELEDSYRR